MTPCIDVAPRAIGRELVRELLQELQVPAAARIELGPPNVVNGDSAGLRQARTNLLSNALRRPGISSPER
jgi:signal transduction histidine kinase